MVMMIRLDQLGEVVVADVVPALLPTLFADSDVDQLLCDEVLGLHALVMLH
jgi:hypothetical protein